MAPAQALMNFNDPMQNYILSVYEGQIWEGIGHGFARIIYGESGKSYVGYHDYGIKYGKGILRSSDGHIIA